MKKFSKIILGLLCVLLLVGCATENKEITLKLFDKNVTGFYTGDLAKKLPEGIGTFTTKDGKYKYIGNWAGGLLEGDCEIYYNDDFLYKGSFSSGKLSALEQNTIKINDNEEKQYVHIGNKGFKIPKSWTYEIKDDNIVYITIPNEKKVQIVFSITEYVDGNAKETCEKIKNGYVDHYGNSFSTYSVLSETGDDWLSGLEDKAENDLHLRFYKAVRVKDVYSHSWFDDPISGNKATYTVTTIQDGGKNNYSEAAKYIINTLQNWESIEADWARQEAIRKKEQLVQYIKNNDWENIEVNAHKATGNDIITFTCKSEIVLIEGIIDNINVETFDMWIPHDGTYHREKEFKTNQSLDSISNGDTIQICIETHSDGSLKKSENILLLRKLNSPTVPNIVEKFKQCCKNIDYNNIMRNPEVARGTIWKASGRVLQVIETESRLQEFLLELSDGNVVYISYYKDEAANNIIEGDYLTTYGTFYMTTTYTNVLGANKTVPKLACYYVDM